MAKYKAKDSFKDVNPDEVLGLGEIECLRQGGTIELDVVPDNLSEHLEQVGTKKPIIKKEVKAKGVK